MRDDNNIIIYTIITIVYTYHKSVTIERREINFYAVNVVLFKITLGTNLKIECISIRKNVLNFDKA